MSSDKVLEGTKASPALEKKAINAIRILAAEGVQAANSGHPGLPMGMAPAAYVLWTQVMRYNPANPEWINRDRFVLSAGHGSMLLYTMLHLTGYDMPLEELKRFRQFDSKTPGHPEYDAAPGIETTTGPLGQGFANGVGMAIAEKWLGARFNKPNHDIINHTIFGIVSDGDLMEGISSEAASLAGHLRLDNLIYLYDDNNITIEGSTDLAFSEDVYKRFEAYGWHVQSVDGLDTEAIASAIERAKSEPRPSIIGCKTVIGYGSPDKAGKASAHGEPLGKDELIATKKNLDWPLEPSFYVPDDVAAFYLQAVERGQALEAAYTQKMAAYNAAYPAEAAELDAFLSGDLPEGWEDALPKFPAGKPMATRNASGTVINALIDVIENLLGGSADLSPSTKTAVSGAGSFEKDSYSGRNMHFGIREHAMAGILNGMALHGGVIPYGGTFLVFSDYMRGGMRLSALIGARVIYVLTHDSIGLGEDGPTHQPIEHLASLRAMPNMTVIRPADANETSAAWKAALENTGGPTVLTLTRQNLPVYDREAEGIAPAEELAKGGYVFWESADNGLDIVLISTGSEVEIAYNAAKELASEGIGVRVVSLPCWELFEAQGAEYQSKVLPADTAKLSIEAGVPFGWERWVGNDKSKGAIIGIDRFGMSAPYKQVYEALGITSANVIAKAKALLS